MQEVEGRSWTGPKKKKRDKLVAKMVAEAKAKDPEGTKGKSDHELAKAAHDTLPQGITKNAAMAALKAVSGNHLAAVLGGDRMMAL